MRPRLQLTTLGLGLALTWAAGVAPARAGLIATISETTSTVGSLTKYTYTVTDAPTSTDNLGEFDLVVPVDANLTSFTMPTGFINVYTAGFAGLSFESTASVYDLTPSQSAMFSFLSPDKPGQATYTFTDYNTGDTATGSVVGPTSVPEPSSFVLIAVGLFLVGAKFARRRSRKLVLSPVRVV